MVDLNTLQQQFVERLPMLRAFAARHFRSLSSETKQEAIEDTLALTWKFFYVLFKQGRAGPEILRSCVFYAVRQTKVGRSVQGGIKKNDALARRSLGPTRVDFDLNYFISRNTPIPDQVVFRVDVPNFFDTLTERQRQIAIELAMSKGTGEVAAKFGVTPAAVSQFRVRFKKWYEQFFAD